MEHFFGVCAGSAIGGGLRYLLSFWMMTALETSMPVGTLTVNILGSFLLAVLSHIGTETTLLSPTVRIALTTGLMGGFTTYSTFTYETMKYLQDGAWAVAAGNVVITVSSCLAACFLGWVAARWLFGVLP